MLINHGFAGSTVFDFPALTDEHGAAEVLLSAKRGKRRSSVDFQDALIAGTPLFSPNGTSAPLRPPTLTQGPDMMRDMMASVPILAPAPKGRRLARLPASLEHVYDVDPEDDADDDYTPSKARRGPVSTVATPPKHKPREGGEDDDEYDAGRHHKEASRGRKEGGPETTEDMMRRESHVCQALQAHNIEEAFQQFSEDACYLVTVYPCKDPACSNSRKHCIHRVNRFQSTRNSKRHIHSYLFYKLHRGMHALVRDEAIRDLWKWLENTCPHGMKNANGHGKDTDGRTCVNPYHYRLATNVSLDSLPS